MATWKKKLRVNQAKAKPLHEKLPWPGLTATDYLSRLVTRSVKEAKEIRENEAWARGQIARVLDFVSPETVMMLVRREAERRKIPAFEPDSLSLEKRLLTAVKPGLT